MFTGFHRRAAAVAFLAAAALALASCATTQPSGQLAAIQSDIEALSGQVARLSAQIDAMDRVVRPLEMRRVTIDLGNAPTLGDPGAKVAIVAFSDFQCPYCRRFHQSSYREIKEHYIDTGKVLMAYRDLPLAFHPLARGAAAAAHCAGDQGRYWETADALFEAQDRLGPELYLEIAAKFELDGDAFADCLDDPKVMARVESDARTAASLGIDGTPTFFVGRVEGGRVVEAIPMIGMHPYESMAAVIESLL